MTDRHEWAKVEAGYDYVRSVMHTADDPTNLMWFGWALREAFVAGAEWQEKRQEQKSMSDPDNEEEGMGLEACETCGRLIVEAFGERCLTCGAMVDPE